VNIGFHKPMLDLIGKLKPVMPSTQFDSFFFRNSGAEAVEAAIKLARGYHGRTVGTMSLTTSKAIYRGRFGPLMPGVHVAPFPYCFTCPVHRAVPQKHNTAAVIVETILGEEGYVPPPKSFSQTIASGFPLSCIVSNKELMDTQPPGRTYSGNAVSCAAAIATLEVFEEEKILENVNNRSFQLFLLLNSWIKSLLPPHIGLDIRGLDLIVGLEFTGVPRGFVAAVAKAGVENHDIILLTTGIYETLRLIPSLTATADESITESRD
ncbi:6665_t:CDS:2, partial [Gigaspora margarita]